MTELDLYRVLGEWELFHGFSDEEIRQFHASGFGRLSEYKKGAEIQRKSLKEMPVTCVLSGTVGRRRLGNAGEILLQESVREGGYLGLDGIRGEQADEMHHYYAETKVLLYHVNPECFDSEDYLGREWYIKLVTNISRILSGTLRSTIRDREFLLAGSLRTKLLLYLEEQRTLTGEDEFAIPYTRNVLAEQLHTNRTALSREIGKMMKEDLVETRGKHFVLKF